MARAKGYRLLLVVVLVGAALAGAAAAQADEPRWADDLAERLDRAAAEYNADLAAGDHGILERWLVRNARVNLYVEGPDGEVAAYAFRTDDEYRISGLRQGTFDDPTLRVRTTKTTVDRIAGASDKQALVAREVQRGKIRVHRVFTVGGLQIPVGVEHVVAGATGAAVVAIAVGKVGLDAIVSAVLSGLRDLAAWLVAGASAVRNQLGAIGAALTILDQLGVLDDFRRAIAWVGVSLRNTVSTVTKWIRRRLRPGPKEREREQ